MHKFDKIDKTGQIVICKAFELKFEATQTSDVLYNTSCIHGVVRCTISRSYGENYEEQKENMKEGKTHQEGCCLE